jgi:hypothetical protein
LPIEIGGILECAVIPVRSPEVRGQVADRGQKEVSGKKKPRVWEPGASLRGAGDELGLVAGDANKSMTTYVAHISASDVPNYANDIPISYKSKDTG